MGKIDELLEVMERLRDPQSGCPWDIRQTFQTIAPYTVEEAYEVADAIERGDNESLCDELGDLLLQVVFHAQIARDLDLFDFDDVVDAITGKMIRRHPHVFGDLKFASEKEQKAHWESVKASERADKAPADAPSALDGVATALPALMRAEKIQKRAARVGLDWSNLQSVIEKLEEESQELQQAIEQGQADAIEDELGDVLYTVVNIARHAGVDAEQALKKATGKFDRRFRQVEAQAMDEGCELSELSAEMLDRYWDRAKLTERS